MGIRESAAVAQEYRMQEKQPELITEVHPSSRTDEIPFLHLVEAAAIVPSSGGHAERCVQGLAIAPRFSSFGA